MNKNDLRKFGLFIALFLVIMTAAGAMNNGAAYIFPALCTLGGYVYWMVKTIKRLEEESR